MSFAPCIRKIILVMQHDIIMPEYVCVPQMDKVSRNTFKRKNITICIFALLLNGGQLSKGRIYSSRSKFFSLKVQDTRIFIFGPHRSTYRHGMCDKHKIIQEKKSMYIWFCPSDRSIVAQWVKRWPADLAVPNSSPAWGGGVQNLFNRKWSPLHTAYHYHPLIVLI